MNLTTSRRRFLGLLGAAAAGSLLLPRFGLAQDSAKAARAAGMPAALEVVELEANLHVVMGAGGNIAVMRGESSLVVDAGLPDRVADVTAALGKLLGDGPKVLVNTHWHFDHVGGNEALGAAGYSIIGSKNCLRRLSEPTTIADFGRTFEPLAEIGRPKQTIDTELDLAAFGKLHLTAFPPSHTDTDLVLMFQEAGVMHTGDIFFNKAFPVIDRSTGGSLDNMITATKRLIGMADDKLRIIPGHGPMATRSDLIATLGLLDDVYARLAPLGTAKATMDEVLAKAPLADLDDKWGRGFLRSPLFTRMAYGQWTTK